MALLGDGLLAIWNDIDPAVEAEFNNWYISEHFAERVGIAGFLRARRYVAAAPGPGPRYAALYETETADVLASPAYIARLNDPTPLTTRMLAQFRNTIRSVGHVAASVGQGVGGSMASLWLTPDTDRAGALEDWLRDTALPGLVAEPAMLAAHSIKVDPALTRNDSTETKVRAEPDRIGDWIVLVEALSDAALAAACAEWLSPDALGARGGAGESRRYRLMHCLVSDDVPPTPAAS